MINEFEITIDTEIVDERILLKKGNSILFATNSISIITGIAKSTKSMFKDLLIQNMFNNEGDFTGEFDGKCIILDTEQSNYFVKKSVERLCKMNVDLDRIHMLAIKSLSTAERISFLKEMITKHKPEIVIIDGLRDLIHDFNSVTETTNLMNTLMKLVSDHKIHICGILHLNPDGNKIRGTLGTEVLNKADAVMKVVKRGPVVSVSSEVMRSKEFKSFKYNINEAGIPILKL